MGIPASAHLATARFVELTDAWERGDVPRARALGHRLTALATAAFAAPNPAVVKGVLHAQGRIPTPDVRLPLLPHGGGRGGGGARTRHRSGPLVRPGPIRPDRRPAGPAGPGPGSHTVEYQVAPPG